MKLSHAERAILTNQLRIRRVLERDRGEGHVRMLDRDLLIIQRGYEKHYGEVLGEMVSDRALPQEDADFVGEVLVMYKAIRRCQEKHPDNAELGKETFAGFDGQSEGPLLDYLRFLVQEPGRWDELKARELDSHSRMRPTYDAMLDAYDNVKERALAPADVYKMTAAGAAARK